MEGMVMKQRVLVTGSEGYIGSVLMPMLLAEGFEVAGLDVCYYADGNLTRATLPSYPVMRQDVRDVVSKDLEGFDAVIHLAALSNDPLGFLDENLTFDINYRGSVRLAEAAREAGVKRFVFASSCSLYGFADKVLTEEDEANPQTAYGKSKVMAEQTISQLATASFSPTFMRNATAYGISPRMRFDLVVNNLAGYAQTEGEIKILGDGTPWRPLVHIRDISAACIAVLQQPQAVVHNQAFNVGNDQENFQIKTIAEHIKKYYTRCEVSIAQKDAGDTRNYRVGFAKLKDRLGFEVAVRLDDGISEIHSAYTAIPLTSGIFADPLYTRLRQIQRLLREDRINSALRWMTAR
jgi:nucleoside-diphosphate-sugar epimerase